MNKEDLIGEITTYPGSDRYLVGICEGKEIWKDAFPEYYIGTPEWIRTDEHRMYDVSSLTGRIGLIVPQIKWNRNWTGQPNPMWYDIGDDPNTHIWESVTSKNAQQIIDELSDAVND